MTSQTITIHILSNTSRSKNSDKIKFGQFIEYTKIKFFKKYYAENKAWRLVPDLFLFFEKALYEVKALGLQLCFDIFQ